MGLILARSARGGFRQLLVTYFVWLLATVGPVSAALPAGDIVVTANISAGDMGLMVIDPATGNRTILSDNTHGTGAPFVFPASVSVTSSGNLLVTDGGTLPAGANPTGGAGADSSPAVPPRVFLVDPTTGDRAILAQDALQAGGVSYPAIGSGPAFHTSVAAREFGNTIVMVDSDIDGDVGGPATGDRVLIMDPATGNRTVVSGAGIGTGPGLYLPGGMQLSGNTVFLANWTGGLLKVDLSTGNRTLLSGGATGTGPAFQTGVDVAAYGGQLVVSGWGNSSTYGYYRIDPVTGDRTMISGSTVGVGPLGTQMYSAIAVEAGGTILSSDGPASQQSTDALLAIDPTTGNRTILSDPTHGTGAAYNALWDVTTVPLQGDANGDGIVNAQDIATLAGHWNQTGFFLPGDTNGDGIVNGQDLAQVASNWLAMSLDHGSTGGGTAVPEPSAIFLATCGLLAMVAWRRAEAS